MGIGELKGVIGTFIHVMSVELEKDKSGVEMCADCVRKWVSKDANKRVLCSRDMD